MSQAKNNIVLLCVSTLFSLLLVEIILRLFVPQETKRLAIYDKDLGWRGRPNGSGIYIRKEDSISVPFTYNDLGYRDDSVRPRSDVSKRIVFVGDSFVENLEVPFEQTYVSIVKKRLKQTINATCDIVALSSQGYSNAQELLALKKYSDVLQPDIVLLMFYTGNDYEDNLRREFAYLDSSGTLVFPANNDSWWKQQKLSFKRWMYESSYLVFFLKNVIESRTALNFGDETKHATVGSDEYMFAITRQLILETKKYVEGRGASFGLVLFTNKHHLRENKLEKTEFVERLCGEVAIPFVEFTHVLRPEHFFGADEHFNAAGHQVVAERVYDFLVNTFPLRSGAESVLPSKTDSLHQQ